MNQLVAIHTKQISGKQQRLVNARELHAFLESKQQFANWIQNRIDQYGFVKDQDFTVNKFINGKATQIEYFITLDMAKELAMVERTDKGKQARAYFIECERVARELAERERNRKRGVLESNEAFVSTVERLEAPQEQKIEAKRVTQFIFEHSTTETAEKDAVDWHRGVCKLLTGYPPSILKERAKERGIPAKNRASGREIMRYVNPKVAQTAAMLDVIHQEGITLEEIEQSGLHKTLPETIEALNKLSKMKELAQ